MLSQRRAQRIRGTLSCFDRMLVLGTLPDIAHARAFPWELNRRGIRIFDFRRFAQGLRDVIRENAERLAEENGLEIEFIKKIKSFRKEDRVQEIGVDPLSWTPQD